MAGWTLADLTALYRPEGLVVLLTWCVNLMLHVIGGTSGPPVESKSGKWPTADERKHDKALLIFKKLISFLHSSEFEVAAK